MIVGRFYVDLRSGELFVCESINASTDHRGRVRSVYRLRPMKNQSARTILVPDFEERCFADRTAYRREVDLSEVEA